MLSKKKAFKKYDHIVHPYDTEKKNLSPEVQKLVGLQHKVMQEAINNIIGKKDANI